VGADSLAVSFAEQNQQMRQARDELEQRDLGES